MLSLALLGTPNTVMVFCEHLNEHAVVVVVEEDEATNKIPTLQNVFEIIPIEQYDDAVIIKTDPSPEIILSDSCPAYKSKYIRKRQWIVMYSKRGR